MKSEKACCVSTPYITYKVITKNLWVSGWERPQQGVVNYLGSLYKAITLIPIG
jgi:hypothetical protein